MNLNDKFLVADVFDVTLIRSGKVIAVEEDNADVSLSLKTSIKEIKAGQGNKLFCTLRTKDSLEIVQNSPKLSLENLAETLGQEIITGSAEGITKSVKARLNEAKVIKLERIPKYPEKLVVTNKGTDLVVGTDYSYTNGEIKILSEDIVENDVIIITPYIFATNEKASKIKIDATSFPAGVELWLTTFAINKSDEKEGLLQFKFYNAVADGALDFATKSERDAVQNKITYKVTSSETDDYGEIVFIPNDEFEKGAIKWQDTPISTVAKDSTGAGDPPYQLFKASYSRSGELSNVVCTISDKATNEVYYKETNTTHLDNGEGSFIWSYRKGLANYDSMSQSDKDIIERNNTNQLTKDTEIVINITMTDMNGYKSSITQEYKITSADVTASKYTA